MNREKNKIKTYKWKVESRSKNLFFIMLNNGLFMNGSLIMDGHRMNGLMNGQAN